LLLGTTTEGQGNADNFTIADSGNCGLTIRSGTSSQGNIFFSDGTSGNSEYDGYIQYQQDTQNMLLGTAGTARARIDSSGRLLVGTDTARSAGDVTAPLQVEGTGYQTSSLNLISNAGASSGNVSHISLAKSRGTSDGSSTVVASGDNLGTVQWCGADGTDLNSVAASIKGEVDATPGSNDMPGRIIFSTTADGAAAPTERMRINSVGTFDFTNGALIEEVEVTSGKLSDSPNINLDNGMVFLFTTAETTTSTPNIRINSTNTLDAAMGNGKVISLTIMTTAAAAGYFTTVTIDGNANGQNSYTLNVDWLGGSAPSAGGSSGIDVYNLTIIKQSSKNFNILIAQNNYA